jgi:cytochrome c-type biogenesis protein CcmH/NrfF
MARRYDFGCMTGNSAAGALMLVCATTGQSIDTGVRYEKTDLTRVKEAKLRLRCPHCHKYHVFSFADAKLRPIRRGEKTT